MQRFHIDRFRIKFEITWSVWGAGVFLDGSDGSAQICVLAGPLTCLIGFSQW
jgi:hypothetical protein